VIRYAYNLPTEYVETTFKWQYEKAPQGYVLPDMKSIPYSNYTTIMTTQSLASIELATTIPVNNSIVYHYRRAYNAIVYCFLHQIYVIPGINHSHVSGR
jgi:hypothetical protein